MSLYKAQNIKLRNLQYILAVAETRSFTKAAELCHATQSTLSSGIKDMETQLGRALFDRTHKHISLTAFGEQILPDIRDVLKLCTQIQTVSQTVDGQYSGPLRLGIIPTIAPYILPELLPHLQHTHPTIQIILNENISQKLVERVKNGELDMALLAFPYEVETLKSRELYEEGFYLLRKKTGTNPAFLTSDEIDVSDLLLLDDGHCLRDHALSVCARQDHQIRQAFRGTSLATLIQMVRHGYGTTLLPEMAVNDHTLNGDLEAIPVKDDGPQQTRDRQDNAVNGRKIGIIWRDKSPLEKTILSIGNEVENIGKKPQPKSEM